MKRLGSWSTRVICAAVAMAGLGFFSEVSLTDVIQYGDIVSEPGLDASPVADSVPTQASLGEATLSSMPNPPVSERSRLPLPVNGVHSLADVSRDALRDESALVLALREAGQARIDDAIANLESLTERNPKFRLAQLVYADLLLAKSQPLTDFGGHANGQVADVAGLRDEAMMRLKRHRSNPPSGTLPEFLIELSDRQRQALVVDVSTSRLYYFENRGGALELVGDYYASTGKKGPMKTREGDQRTPVGVYFVTRRIPSEQLPDFYGWGALPVNYPNEWDGRLGRTGFGIWIHGVPSNTYSRVPRASDGCVALANEDLSQIWGGFDLDRPAYSTATPVVIANGIEWVQGPTLETRRRAVRERLEEWRRDWESLDFERYKRHYSKRFRSESKNHRAWLDYKQRVNASKTSIRVDISGVSIFGYPGEDGLVVVTFDQDYRSSNFKSQSAKRQYWRQEPDGVWRIVYEGSAAWRPVHTRGIPYSGRSNVSSFNP